MTWLKTKAVEAPVLFLSVVQQVCDGPKNFATSGLLRTSSLQDLQVLGNIPGE